MEAANPAPQVCCPVCNSSDVRWWRTYKRRHRYVCGACKHRFFAEFSLLDTVNSVEGEYAKEVWDIRNLGAIGLEAAKISAHYKLDFTDIPQPWLRTAAKQFCRFCLATIAFRTVSQRLCALRHLSTFLQCSYPSIEPSDIDRQIILKFLSYLVGRNLGGRSRQAIIYNVRVFFEQCIRNEWLDLPKHFILIYPEDIPPREKPTPRFIPQEVLEQLNQHIADLPDPVMRMFLIIQECGMRISELCLMPFDCIRQDASGDWWLTYYQYKMRKDHTITISRELSKVIQEQQRYIRSVLPLDYKYLCCANAGGWPTKSPSSRRIIEGRFTPAERPPRTAFLGEVLNNLAEKYNIRTHAGDQWRFQSHQFRHTVGTSMINRGVPIHIVSRFLGHETLGMTQVYAHIHDPTLKQEIAKFHEKIVDITGKVIAIDPNSEIDNSDHQWFKRNVLAQALANGSCALPVHMKECPHANACMTCTHFRTTVEFLDHHKMQLAQTEELLQKAKANGWQRQIEMNEKVASNLRKIITGLEIPDAPT